MTHLQIQHQEATAILAAWLGVERDTVLLVHLDPYGWRFRSLSHPGWGVDQTVPTRD